MRPPQIETVEHFQFGPHDSALKNSRKKPGYHEQSPTNATHQVLRKDLNSFRETNSLWSGCLHNMDFFLSVYLQFVLQQPEKKAWSLFITAQHLSFTPVKINPKQ